MRRPTINITCFPAHSSIRRMCTVSGKTKHYWQDGDWVLVPEFLRRYMRLRVGDDERTFDGEFGHAYLHQLRKEPEEFLPRY